MRPEGRRQGRRQAPSAKELIVYQKAYRVVVEIFEISKTFAVEERYSLTSQIRRSLRSVWLNLREARDCGYGGCVGANF